jgi:hypothetical protein
MTMLMKTLAAVAAGTVLATSAFAATDARAGRLQGFYRPSVL